MPTRTASPAWRPHTLAFVADVEEVSWRTVPRPAPRYLDTASPGQPSVVLAFAQPVVVTGPLGLRRTVGRTVERVGLRLDDPAGFVAVVRRCRTG